jgi:hypothetical protein
MTSVWSGPIVPLYGVPIWAAIVFPTQCFPHRGYRIIFIEGPKFEKLRPTHRTRLCTRFTQWRAQHSKTNEGKGGGSCTGRSRRIGPSLPIGSGRSASGVVHVHSATAFAAPTPPLSSSQCIERERWTDAVAGRNRSGHMSVELCLRARTEPILSNIPRPGSAYIKMTL